MSSERRQPPQVTLRQGVYRGKYLAPTRIQPKALDVFLGIPYAQSTAGENRFRPAKPVDADVAGEVRDATRLGPISPFTEPEAEPLPAGEDCLSVNVTRPAAAAAEGAATTEEGRQEESKLPVLVYVHGGAFNMGFGADRDLASFVAHAKRDVVAVSFNYRLGVLGFLAAEGPDGAQGLNLGLRDQRMAMEWVRENIAAFGGDPAQVTAMGISAGGHSLGHHILSYAPGSAPFQRAILESGSATSRAIWHPSHPRQKTQLAEFLAAAGVHPDTNDTAADPLSALRSLSVADLTAAAARVWRRYVDSVRWPFQPVIDGADIVPDRPLALWDAATQSPPCPDIPIITGFCSHEGTAFAPPCASPAAFRAFFTALIPTLQPADLDRLDALYPLDDPDADPDCPRTPADRGPHWARLQAAYAHYAYIAPVLYTAHRLSLLPAPPPVYVYEFAALAGPFRSANHTDETPFVTHSLHDLEPHRGLVDVSARMHGWFADFVSADPQAPVLDGWPVFQCPLRGGPEAAKIMVFGRGNDERIPPEDGGRASTGVPAEVRTMTAREVEQIKFWWDRTALSQGFGERDPA